MLKSRILGGLSVAILTAALAATSAVTTTANGKSIPSSPAEKAATAALNKKISDENAAAEARAQAQKIQYDAQKQAYEQQRAQYEQQLKNAEFNRAPAP